MLVDVFGATPCNAALRLADPATVRVVAGVNVPMMWRALCYADEPLDALVARAVTGASQGVMPLAAHKPMAQQRPDRTSAKTTILIRNKLGLHARASAKLTKLAGSFACDVHMSRNGRRVNAKSIMGVMMLAAGMGSEIEIETEGEQEVEAMAQLRALIDDRFGEGE